ncbi:MAG: hypothetical protein OEV14_10090 [Gammaproteobacteria bacterium]|nr:hypothetical protein [Gammaproteobacteria bacterium]
MVLAIIIGYFSGAALAFFVARRLLEAMANRLALHDAQRRSMKVAGAVLGAIALAPSIFLAMIVGGGSVAGRYAGMVSRALGWGEAGALPILSLALMLIITITVAVIAAMGAGMGYLGAPGPHNQSLRTGNRSSPG